MRKIILTRGIPASGKTTWAKQEVLTNGAIRFNKDDIRKDESLFPAGYFYDKGNEQIVMEEERDRVLQAVVANTPYIIIDNTHLGNNNKHISFYRELAEKYGYEFEIKDFYCSREEAIKRDKERPENERVGEDVINKMIKIQGNGGYPHNPKFTPLYQKRYSDFTKRMHEMPKAIIIDIDGTLAFMDGKRGPFEFEKVQGDRANEHLIHILNYLKGNNKLFIVSGREETCKTETLQWLKSNKIPYDKLYMRKEGDNRCDTIIKSEIYEEHIKDKYNVFAVFDDRQKVVDMWRLKYNLPTYQVWYGNF